MIKNILDSSVSLQAKKFLIKVLVYFCIIFLCSISYAASPKPLHVDKAFQFSAALKDNQTIIVRWKIAKNYYLYRDRFHFTTANPKKVRLGQPLLPTGVNRHSPEIGDYQVYSQEVNIAVPIIDATQNNFTLYVKYQGCSNQSFCYPPTEKKVQLAITGPYQKFFPGQNVQGTPVSATPDSATSKINKLLNGANLVTLILGFIGFGLLISLTPCVLPMIPILSGIIVGQKKISTIRSFVLSLAYVSGMAITYACAGIAFGYVGSSIQAALQKPWIIGTFSLVFILLALSLFGFYNLNLPEKIRSRFAHASDHLKHGDIIGVIFMGVLSTLILSPCVTPPLVAVLGFISQTGNALIGGIALFSMAIGMGTPLLLIGAFGPQLLPKAGPWMNIVKQLLGILLLGVAVWMLSRILPGYISLFLWAFLAIGTSIYMGALSSAKTLLQKIFKCLGLLLFIYGITMLIGAFSGNSNPLKPLNFDFSTPAQQTRAIKFISVKTIADVKGQLAKAHTLHKPALLDFYADWCIACKEMDRYTFNNPQVRTKLRNYLLLRADVTENNANDKALQKYFGVVAPPTILFFDKDNQREIPNSRIIGELSAKNFLKHMQQIESLTRAKTLNRQPPSP